MSSRADSRDAPRPALVVVYGEPEGLAFVGAELERRYGADYEIVVKAGAGEALAALSELKRRGADVALVLAGPWLDEPTGAGLLARVPALHPQARRALLVGWRDWADRATREAMLRAMALGHIDYYVIRPIRRADEQFHRAVTEFLDEWSRAGQPRASEITLVAERWAPRAHELRSLLARHGTAQLFWASDSPEGRRLLEENGLAGTRDPVAIMLDGTVLVDPTNAELAEAFGVATELDGSREFDVVVVGAGPAGLSAAVYASSEGLRVLVVEREAIGGQAGSTSLIRNYLGFQRGLSGGDLAHRAYEQAWVFGARFLMMREVTGLRTEAGRHVLSLSGDEEVTAGAVVLACGVAYRRIGIASLEELTGSGVFYGASIAEARGLAGRHVCVVGAGNSAGQAAVHLAREARQVSLLVRESSLEQDMSHYLRRAIAAADNIDVRLETQVVDAAGDGHLERLTLRDSGSGKTFELDTAALFLMIGAQPHTDWLPQSIARDPNGYVLTGPEVLGEGWPLARPPRAFETGLPGVFAVGDVARLGWGRIAAAVGQGSVVIQQVHAHLRQR